MQNSFLKIETSQLKSISYSHTLLVGFALIRNPQTSEPKKACCISSDSPDGSWVIVPHGENRYRRSSVFPPAGSACALLVSILYKSLRVHV